MVKTLLYGILLGIVGYALWLWQKTLRGGAREGPTGAKMSPRFRVRNSREPWVQVYETASPEDAQRIQARLEEEEVECLVYEQGKKDIEGQSLKGIGIAVPKSAVPLAQRVISRMPV